MDRNHFNNFERGPTKDHSCEVWSKSNQWFRRRCCLKIVNGRTDRRTTTTDGEWSQKLTLSLRLRWANKLSALWKIAENQPSVPSALNIAGSWVGSHPAEIYGTMEHPTILEKGRAKTCWTRNRLDGDHSIQLFLSCVWKMVQYTLNYILVDEVPEIFNTENSLFQYWKLHFP